MVKSIKYPVKIHYPGCTCNHYKDKTSNPNQMLVSPYMKADFRNKFYIYNCESDFVKDKELFIDNCICTHSNGIYNGGVVVITANVPSNFKITNSDELVNVRFELLEDVKNSPDNSHLINTFCKLFSTLLNFYSVIGNTISTKQIINYTFPKGKISICDKSSEDCCYREFTEETNYILDKTIINEQYQLKMRQKYKIKHIPFDVIIDNFLLKIIVI
jgi:hypothetical protein